MIVIYSLIFVIGLLVVSVVGWYVFVAVSEKHDLLDPGYREACSADGCREKGPEELGTEAVLQERLARGEIDRDTFQDQIDHLHHTAGV